MLPNRYAVPFEEDDRDPTIWFLDHSYLEELFQMFRRVNGNLPALPFNLYPLKL